jgi:hypothetical protein
MKPDRAQENVAFFAGLGTGWLAAVLVLWVWAGLPQGMVALMCEAGLVPVLGGLVIFARAVWKSVEVVDTRANEERE